MDDSTVVTLEQPGTFTDHLSDLIRTSARDLIAEAVQQELEALLSRPSNVKKDGRQAVIRNGYLPEREIQTGIGPVSVKVPKVRDRIGQGIKFTSAIIPPYLKRSKTLEEFIPWLYLRGVSTGDFTDTLSTLLGDNAKGLSANTVGRLKAKWEEEHKGWIQRDLSGKKICLLLGRRHLF